MTNYNEIIYKILSNMVLYMKDDVDGYETPMANTDYLQDLSTKLDNLYDERNSNFDEIKEYLSRIKIENIRSLRKILKEEISSEKGFRYILSVCKIKDELIDKFCERFVSEDGFNYKEKYLMLMESFNKLKDENAKLKEENLKLKSSIKTKKSIKFSKKNITAESIMDAEVIIHSGEYTQRYSTFKEAIEKECIYETDINGGFSNIANLLNSRLKKAPNSKFGVICTNTGYRIDFYFED